MQWFVLALAMGLLLHDGFGGADSLPMTAGWIIAAGAFVPMVVVGAAYHVLCIQTLRKLGKVSTSRLLVRLDRVGAVCRLMLITTYVSALLSGALTAWRRTMGDLILVDELLFMTPPLAALLWMWWAYYPIDRRLRESQLFRLLDEGKPIHPVWIRRQYIVAQLRHNLALMGAPLVLLLGWSELVAEHGEHWLGFDARHGFMLAGAGCVFLLSPVIIRHLWDTAPLPAGELRDRLVAMCRMHVVGVRELLLWRTFGGIVNAAVMGAVAPLRYILLSDALLDQMEDEQVEAVMAHEIAHVRKHHMFWLIVVAGAGMSLLEYFWRHVLSPLDGLEIYDGYRLSESYVAGAAVVVAIACWAVMFGWVSRRLERQADTFAVAHLTRGRADPTDAEPRIDPISVARMQQALQQVADLNHMSTTRRSWRHGSIAWRQAYLGTLIGEPVCDLRIDRQVWWIKLAGAAGLMVLLCIVFGSGADAQQWILV